MQHSNHLSQMFSGDIRLDRPIRDVSWRANGNPIHVAGESFCHAFLVDVHLIWLKLWLVPEDLNSSFRCEKILFHV